MRSMGDPDYVYRPTSEEHRRKQSEAQRRRLGIPPGHRRIAGLDVPEGEVAATLARLYPCEACGAARSPTARKCLPCARPVRRAAPPPVRRRADEPRRVSKARQRVLNGQCPTCGKDAAPYRLCADHRQLASLTRLLSRWEKAGALTKERGAGGCRWKPTANMREIIDAMPVSKMPLWEGGDDARTLPRLRGVPVDVGATLVALLKDRGSPATLEEIQAAWGRLRGERKHGSLSADVDRIIKAQRKREAKAARIMRAPVTPNREHSDV